MFSRPSQSPVCSGQAGHTVGPQMACGPGREAPWAEPHPHPQPAVPWTSYGVGQPHAKVSRIGGGRESPGRGLAVLWAGAAVGGGPWGRRLTDSVPLRCACREDGDAFRLGITEPETPKYTFYHRNPGKHSGHLMFVPAQHQFPFGVKPSNFPWRITPPNLNVCGKGLGPHFRSSRGTRLDQSIHPIPLTMMDWFRGGHMTQDTPMRCNFKFLFWLLRMWEGEAVFPLGLGRKQARSCW